MGQKRFTRSSWMAAWASMAERYFEPAEVETLIPTLARVMAKVMGANEEATTIAARLQAERERIGLAGGGMIDRTAWKADMDRVEHLTETVKAGLGQINEMGGTIKDLALGHATLAPELASVLIEAHKAELSKAASFPAHYGPLLRRLARDYRLAVVSNFDYTPTAIGILEAAGVLELFAAVIVSDAVGWRKPRPDIFRRALAAT